jgi:FkbM family methyltransferase
MKAARATDNLPPMPAPLPDSGPLYRVAERVRRKAISLLGGMADDSAAQPAPTDALDTALRMLYPTREPTDLRAQSRALVGDGPADLHDVRRLLSTFDRQFFPSPVSVRFGPEDIVTHRLENGMTIFLDREDGAVSRPLLNGDYEAHLLPIFEEFCRPGMTVVDVGANVGLYTLVASGLVGTSGRVVAVEPSSENCRLILLSVDANQAGNVELLPVALDRRRGWANLSGHFGSNGGLVAEDPSSLASGWSEIVASFALDDLVDGQVDFLKIDVEGAEGRVVAGAQRILETSRPIVTTELSLEMLPRVSGISGEEYLEGFASLGYRICLLNRETGRADAPTTAAQLLADWKDPLQIEDLLLLPPDH